jgi:2,3-diketo-5-methylthio-1-phosphopentane phosphatase
LTIRVDRGAVGAILLDIEGTMTSIAFVYETLFPFARRHLREFLKDRRGTPELADVFVRLELEWAEDVARGNAPPPWGDASDVADGDLSLVAGYVEWLMDRDRKSPALKLLQGYIWERGYRAGELTSELYGDVVRSIERWRREGLLVAIYSSGSELAQRLLFSHTNDGDLTRYFSGFFDTAVGPKISADSYRRIAATLGLEPWRVLFVSDVMKELDAAREAGCRAILCVRPGNPPQSPASDIEVIHSFDELGFT